MSQRSEKLHRQVAQLRSDVDALQVAWLSQQHCDAVELAAAAERTRQAHRRASEAQRTARAWKLNAILTLILAALIAGVALVISAKAAEKPTTPPSSAITDNGRLSGDDTPAQEPLRLDQAHVLENVTVTHYDCCVECCGKTDGITASGTHATSVTTQKGVALQTNEQIRPLVKLRPYRTYQEVEQPESIFLIRVNDRGISFFEADGGMWKLAARQTIKKYLESRLEQEVSEGSVHVVL